MTESRERRGGKIEGIKKSWNYVIVKERTPVKNYDNVNR
jgi:hypothetical protein